jgi:hypothetical protein
MATSINFTTLVSQISAYIERGGSATGDPLVAAQIPFAINGAERKLIQTLKLLGQIEFLVDPAGFQPGTTIIPKPDRWRQTVSITYGAGANNNKRVTLFARDYEYCRAYWPDDSVIDPNNPPKFYSDTDLQHWLISPTSDSTYPVEYVVYMQPPLLDSTTQTNFWTNYTPNALLYASLLEMTPFLKADDRVPLWQSYWSQEIQSLGGQDLQRMMDRTSQRRAD